MQKHLVKAFNNHNKPTDLTSFGDNDLILNIANNLNTAGKFTHNGFVFHNEFIHEPIYWYVNFPLNNNLRIISFSCEQTPPSSNVISLIRNNIYLSFKNTQLRKKVENKNKEIEKLKIEIAKQPNKETNNKEESSTPTHLLLAEDNPANQVLISQQLELLGYLVDVVEDGEKAYDKWSSGKYSLILTDCNMPVMDGFELTDAIREHEKRNGGHIPIIAVTANAMQGEDKKCLAKGMDGYLSKPIKLKSLKETLNQWIPLKTEEKNNSDESINENSNQCVKSSRIIVNFSTITELIGDDPIIQKQFLNSLLETLPSNISDTISACETRSKQKVEFALHKLKPSVGSAGAELMLNTISQIESSLPEDWQKTIELAHSLNDDLKSIENSINLHFDDELKLTNSGSINKSEDSEFSFQAPSGTNVLVIDDDPFMLDYIKILLLKLKIDNISSAPRGDVALNMITENEREFDIIICDLNMPEMDGVTLLRHLTRWSFKGGIIISSGADSNILSAVSALANAHNLNLLGSLQKPITPQSLVDLFKIFFKNKNEVTRSYNQPKKTGITVSALENAIEQNHIIAYYQPKIDIKTKSVVGFEALARWIDPEQGIIPPYLFIPLAEENNLIDKLTRIMFEQVIHQAAKWLLDYPTLKFAVNFSMNSLQNLELPELIGKAIKNFEIAPGNIIVEVTESGLTDNLTATMEVLARLKLQGFALSIDDFGTGYSSMNQLQNLPFSELKLDYSFVHGGSTNKKSKAILESSIHLANKLNLSTVAEGVEDLDDWNLVKELGCDVVQGYFIAKPMPVNEATYWLKQWPLENHDHL
ncbi:MAG: EAL domain-containing protein [Kangiellaceae bacterium]